MDHPASSAISGCWLTTVHPREHNRCSSPILALLLPSVPCFLEELPDLLIHHIEIIVDIVRPHIKIGKLNRNLKGFIESEAGDDIFIWSVLAIPTNRVEQLARI